MDALILEIGTSGLHRYVSIEGEITTIGRALDNDIILSDPTVAPHHLKIVRSDDSLELINLAEINQTRADPGKLELLLTKGLPLKFEIGRIQVQLLRRDFEVSATRPLAGNRRPGHLFGHGFWTLLLVLISLGIGALEFYLNAYTSFNWSDLIKYVLRETVLSLGAFVIALSVLERLLVNRWEIRQLLTTICLVYLLYTLLNIASDALIYLFSANWPATVSMLAWYLGILPAAIALYLTHISHLKRKQSLLLALLIAGPIALPSLLQNGELKALLDDFSPVARYQNALSSVNWHLTNTVSVDEFIKQAGKLDQGEFAD